MPNPGKIVCEAGKLYAVLVEISLDLFYNTISFQDGLVDGAEIEAAFEHTTNLLSKQCSLYDQVAKRCSEILGIGSGCNGVDDDNDNLVDECDEDVIPPVIYTESAAGACSHVWFASAEEARKCVEDTIVIEDDCHNTTTPIFSVDNDCGLSQVTVEVADDCGNIWSESIPVKIHDTAPQVYCHLADEQVREASRTTFYFTL